MTKITQNLILEGEYSKIGSKIINKSADTFLYILKKKTPTITKPPFYLFTNQLGKSGYISSLYPLQDKQGGDIDKTPTPKYLIEYKGAVYQFTDYDEKVTIELTPKQKLTF